MIRVLANQHLLLLSTKYLLQYLLILLLKALKESCLLATTLLESTFYNQRKYVITSVLKWMLIVDPDELQLTTRVGAVFNLSV